MKNTYMIKSVAAATLMLLGAFTMASAKSGEVRLRTDLSGSAINGITPKGHVDYRLDDKGRGRFTVEVENVNLPVGTVLTVQVMRGTTAVALAPNQITLAADPAERGNRGELELETEHGATVPDLSSGAFTIQVNNGAATILTGALHN